MRDLSKACWSRLVALTLALGAPPAAAQVAGMPAGWRAITDTPAEYSAEGIDPNPGARYNFVNMAPGWHITTGPGTLLFNPGMPATGRFRVETELFFFPNPGDQPLGLFVGGAGLEGPLANIQWFGLLIRRDGHVAVAHARGGELHALRPWGGVDSVSPHPVSTSQRLILAVDAEADSVRFFVNRQRVAAFARAGLNPEGPFGFRVGQGLNLHVVRLDYTTKLAPARGQ